MGALNIDQRFGLRPVMHLNGNPWNGMTQKCYVHASYATALFIGDPVAFITETDHQDTLAMHYSIERATLADGNYCLGAIVAFEPDRDNLSRIYIPASTGGYAYVCTDPDVLFEIRDDGVTLPTKLWCGQNAIMIATHAGDTTTGISGMELDSNADPPEANASNMLLIHHLAEIEGNTLAKRAIWIVSINMHQLRATGDGDGALGVTAT